MLDLPKGTYGYSLVNYINILGGTYEFLIYAHSNMGSNYMSYLYFSSGGNKQKLIFIDPQ